MKEIILTTMFVALAGHAAEARPPLAELDGRAPFIGAELSTSQTEAVRTLTAAWRRDAVAAHAALADLHRAEQDLVEANGPVDTATLKAVLAHEEAIDQTLAMERVRNEIAIHDLLSPAQLTEAARTVVVWARPIRTAFAAGGPRDSAAATR